MALLAGGSEDAAPELSLLNLVDLMLVFAVGLLLAIVSYYGLKEVMLEKEATMVVSQPGRQEIEVIRKTASKVERMRLTQQSLDGEGVRIGIAYRLTSGEIVYVPEPQNAPLPGNAGGQP
jgi:hypothetical protein